MDGPHPVSYTHLLEGIAAVPLEALNTLYVLAFPRDLYEYSEETRLKNIVALYQAHEDVLAFLKATRHIGDQVTSYELEWKATEKSLADFDPFPYTSRSELGNSENLSVVSSKDYDFIPDFHPSMCIRDSARHQRLGPSLLKLCHQNVYKDKR